MTFTKPVYGSIEDNNVNCKLTSLQMVTVNTQAMSSNMDNMFLKRQLMLWMLHKRRFLACLYISPWVLPYINDRF